MSVNGWMTKPFAVFSSAPASTPDRQRTSRLADAHDAERGPGTDGQERDGSHRGHGSVAEDGVRNPPRLSRQPVPVQTRYGAASTGVIRAKRSA